MEKKVIDLEIIDELEESGTQKISLVDSPAIEKNWMYFSKTEKFVEPNSGESESDYMTRCVPTLLDEGKPQEQAVAICISTYQNMQKVFEFDAFAAYPWDQCIADAEGRGLDEESASKLCGWIKANMEKIKCAKVSFDFDDTLSTAAGLEMAKRYADKGDTLYIISARNEVSSGMEERAKELGIPMSRVYATGSNKAKVEKVNSLGIDKHIDNNADVISELGGKGLKFEINTGGLAPYTQQTPKNKKDLIEKSVNFAAVLEKAKTLGFSAEDFTTNGLEFHSEETFDIKLAKGYTVYKYTGSVGADTRDFCREMVNLNRFYTFEEIAQLSDTDPNPGLGLGGSDNYSIWKYKGGANCKHRWTKFYVTEQGAYQNKGAAPGDAGTKPFDMPNRGYAFAAVEDKREIVGPVAIPDMEIFRKDKKGNPYYVKFSKDVIRRMAEKFLREGRVNATNVDHQDIDAGTYIFESWLVENPEDKANTIYNLDVPVGTWMVKGRVVNDNVWSGVKEGKFNGWSLEGDFVSKEEYDQYMKEKKMYQNLISLLNGF